MYAPYNNGGPPPYGAQQELYGAPQQPYGAPMPYGGAPQYAAAPMYGVPPGQGQYNVRAPSWYKRLPSIKITSCYVLLV